jgi:hypothetical protein
MGNNTIQQYTTSTLNLVTQHKILQNQNYKTETEATPKKIINDSTCIVAHVFTAAGNMFIELLPRNSSGIFAYLAVTA